MLDNPTILMFLTVIVVAICTAMPEKTSSSPQLEDVFTKRNWKSDMGVWGKRGWNEFHSADWGKRNDEAGEVTDDDLPLEDEYTKRVWKNDMPVWGKRAWQKFEANGWGKRSNALENEYSKRVWKNEMPLWGKRSYTDDANELEQNDKRAWKEMPLWGKRSWKSQPAAWGKRADDGEDYSDLTGPLPKKAWKSDMGVWGKRGQMDRWTRFQQGSWGKRSGGLEDKRAWNAKLNGDWGKRFVQSEDDIALQQLAAAMDEGNNFSHTLAKRGWQGFSVWGKKADNWEKFRGTWGKRSDRKSQQWSNLKGVWGKRNIEDNSS